MRERIGRAIERARADYVEIRIEERTENRVVFRGRDFEGATSAGHFGIFIRALVGGGWGIASFNDPAQLERRLDEAVAAARTVGRERFDFKARPAIVDEVRVDPGVDPGSVALSEKVRLAGAYNTQLVKHDSRIRSTQTDYRDEFVRKTLATSEKTWIEQEHAEATLMARAVARDGANVREIRELFGGPGGFEKVRDLDDRIADMARRAIASLDTRPVKGGRYPVILNPGLAGVFIHEAFGHLSESDFLHTNPRLREIFTLGRNLGCPILNVVDSPRFDGLRGTYDYDDEGIPAAETLLIQGGILTGRLHSRETAGRMGETPTGNARALDYRYPPIVRMSNTCIMPGTATFETMMREIEEGIYAVDSFGGQTNGELFTFSAAEAFMVRGGQLAERVRDVVLSGNVFETLARIDAVGDDLNWRNGGCGKGEQSPLPVCVGSPHIRIQDVMMGGH